MEKQKLQLIILLCYFAKSSVTCAQGNNGFPKGHLEKLGAHQPPEGNIGNLQQMPSARTFYENYVTTSKPVIFKAAAKETDSFKLWTDNYLK